MKKREFLIYLGVLLIVAFCCKRGGSEDEIVARVNNATLTKKQLRKQMEWDGIDIQQESEYVDRWIDRELLYQEARRLKRENREELKWMLEKMEKEYLINKLIEKTFSEKINITDEEISFFYENNKSMFTVAEDEVRALHILTKTKKDADAARQQIMAGKPFDQVAKEYSVGIFKDRGGDMGFFKRDEVIPEIGRYAFRLSEGGVSPVFKSSHGYHIIKVLKKRLKGEVRSIEDVRDEIFQQLRASKERSVYQDLLYQLKNRADVLVVIPPREVRPDSLKQKD